MALGQEMVPVGHVVTVLYNDASMNGSNGPVAPIVVEPDDRQGPTTNMPKGVFYMYVPQFP